MNDLKEKLKTIETMPILKEHLENKLIHDICADSNVLTALTVQPENELAAYVIYSNFRSPMTWVGNVSTLGVYKDGLLKKEYIGGDREINSPNKIYDNIKIKEVNGDKVVIEASGKPPCEDETKTFDFSKKEK